LGKVGWATSERASSSGAYPLGEEWRMANSLCQTGTGIGIQHLQEVPGWLKVEQRPPANQKINGKFIFCLSTPQQLL